VNPEDVKFEAVEPPQPGEEEGERIEQILGFERSPDRAREESDYADDFGDDDIPVDNKIAEEAKS
jgi:hypothetical protein